MFSRQCHQHYGRHAHAAIAVGTKIAVKLPQRMSDNTEVLIEDLTTYEGDDIMPALATYPEAIPATSSDPASITTTLYDLIAALNAEVDPEDDALVTAAVVHLINANRARFIGSRKRLAIVDA